MNRHGLWLLIESRKGAYRWSLKASVAQCAYRYMRLHGLQSVSTWNELVWVIARRCSRNPSITAGSLTICAREARKPTRTIEFCFSESGECIGARAKYPKGCGVEDVEYRADTIRELRAARRAREMEIASKTCALCGLYDELGPRQTGVAYRTDITLYLPRRFDNEQSGGDVSLRADDAILCVPCWNKMRPICQRAHEVVELNRLIRKIEREIEHDAA